jgi:hypothetical protein
LADSIYWVEFPAAIRHAPLAGGGPVGTVYDSPPGTWNVASGLAIDSAAGRIYWTSYGDDGPIIRRAPLAGGGPVDTLYDAGHGVSQPLGLAIDPAARQIYWSNGGDNKIQSAPLAGMASGVTADTLYDAAHGVSGPTGMAIDPAAGQIYWADSGIATIRGAPLAGMQHGGTPVSLYGPADVGGPIGVAIDAAAGRIYWTNWSWGAQGAIRGARLAGAGTVDYDGTLGVSQPVGLAIDPNPAAPARIEPGDAGGFEVGRWFQEVQTWVGHLFSRPSAPPGRIYWSNGTGGMPTPSDKKIQGAPLAADGSVETLYGFGPPGPSALALLRAPVGTGPPTIKWEFVLEGPFGGLQFGGSHSGPLDRQLTCSRGAWAPDLLGSLLYRAPQSFAYQWRLNGTDIGAATTEHYTPNAPGSYSCRVTATNQAGSATQTSMAVAIS